MIDDELVDVKTINIVSQWNNWVGKLTKTFINQTRLLPLLCIVSSL